MRQRRIRAWQAWLAIAGLVGHLLAMVAMSDGAHAGTWVVDPATGQRLEVSLCTDEGLVPAPEGPASAHAPAHDCVLCSVHGAGGLARPPTLAPAGALVAGVVWAPSTARAPDARAAVAGWPRGPPHLG